MRHKIVWSETAERQLRKLDYTIARRIYLKVGELSESLKNVKKLAGNQGYRLRVGDYRVVFDIDKNEITILIMKVAHRRSIYKDSS